MVARVPAPKGPQLAAGVVTAALGLVTMAVGGTLWGVASGRRSEALAPTTSGVLAVSDNQKAQSLALVGDVLFGAGAGVALAGGVVMVVALVPRRVDFGPKSFGSARSFTGAFGSAPALDVTPGFGAPGLTVTGSF